MARDSEKGLFRLENGMWGYRYCVIIDGRKYYGKKTTDEEGNKLKTKTQAAKARDAAIAQAHEEAKKQKEDCKKDRFGGVWRVLQEAQKKREPTSDSLYQKPCIYKRLTPYLK